nr:hypothetical protein [Amylibacter sp.]
MLTIGDLMRETPKGWGLRGDPFLWEQLRTELNEIKLPRSRSELALKLEQLFGKVTERSLALESEFVMPEHAHGGMSSGMISCLFWRETAFPLILNKFDKIVSAEE